MGMLFCSTKQHEIRSRCMKLSLNFLLRRFWHLQQLLSSSARNNTQTCLPLEANRLRVTSMKMSIQILRIMSFQGICARSQFYGRSFCLDASFVGKEVRLEKTVFLLKQLHSTWRGSHRSAHYKPKLKPTKYRLHRVKTSSRSPQIYSIRESKSMQAELAEEVPCSPLTS